MTRPWAADLLHLWFHELSPGDWFAPSPATDALIRARHGDTLAMLRNARADDLDGSARLTLAAILLFDQVPRNLFRDSQQQFAWDPLARTLTRRALAQGHDRLLDRHQRQFMAMPLMHSEEMRDQRLALAFYARRGNRGAFPFARAHARMIARFGRFPHRNAVLGRRTTPAEQHAIDAGFAW